MMLKLYACDCRQPKGVFRAHVCYNSQEFEADPYVVDSDGPALFWSDWLQNIVFDCPVVTLYVFGSEQGHLQPSHWHLPLNNGAQPKFLKASLELDGILTKVLHHASCPTTEVGRLTLHLLRFQCTSQFAAQGGPVSTATHRRYFRLAR